MEEAAIRLLIVDDNPELCDILENYFNLTSEITVCGVARDGEEALFRIAQSQPDVVLLDLIMPKLDGITVLERLAQAELAHRPRFIVTSAIGQDAFTNTDKQFIIQCSFGSYAEEYARKNKFKYQLV